MVRSGELEKVLFKLLSEQFGYYDKSSFQLVLELAMSRSCPFFSYLSILKDNGDLIVQKMKSSRLDQQLSFTD